ncbi:MAG: hypothetical protein OEW48_19530, partial [Phycisphaerae bacterium]|nr:hypothetical protein [Phycisphaerae bacterium]
TKDYVRNYKPFYAKQSQFPKSQVERKSSINNRLRANGHLVTRENKANSKPIKANSKPIKANIMPKQTQFKPNTNPISEPKNAAAYDD